MSKYWFKVNRLSFKIQVIEVLRETTKTLVIAETAGERRISKEGWEIYCSTYTQAEKRALSQAEGEVRACRAALESAEEKERKVRYRAVEQEVEDIDLQMRPLTEVGDPDPAMWRIKIEGGYFDARHIWSGMCLSKDKAPTLRSKKRATLVLNMISKELKPKLEKVDDI